MPQHWQRKQLVPLILREANNTNNKQNFHNGLQAIRTNITWRPSFRVRCPSKHPSSSITWGWRLSGHVRNGLPGTKSKSRTPSQPGFRLGTCKPMRQEDSICTQTSSFRTPFEKGSCLHGFQSFKQTNEDRKSELAACLALQFVVHFASAQACFSITKAMCPKYLETPWAWFFI